MPTDYPNVLETGGAEVRRLQAFQPTGYDKGRGRAVQALWFCTLNLVFMKWWCPARMRVWLLRRFGATIGSGVLIRHRVRVLWPWKLSIGDHSWLGEGAWLLNLEPITLGDNVCISQDALLCTGSHNHRDPAFGYDNAPIAVESGAWIGARATVLRGVTVGAGAAVAACARVDRDVAARTLIRQSVTPIFH